MSRRPPKQQQQLQSAQPSSALPPRSTLVGSVPSVPLPLQQQPRLSPSVTVGSSVRHSPSLGVPVASAALASHHGAPNHAGGMAHRIGGGGLKGTLTSFPQHPPQPPLSSPHTSHSSSFPTAHSTASVYSTTSTVTLGGTGSKVVPGVGSGVAETRHSPSSAAAVFMSSGQVVVGSAALTTLQRGSTRPPVYHSGLVSTSSRGTTGGGHSTGQHALKQHHHHHHSAEASSSPPGHGGSSPQPASGHSQGLQQQQQQQPPLAPTHGASQHRCTAAPVSHVPTDLSTNILHQQSPSVHLGTAPPGQQAPPLPQQGPLLQPLRHPLARPALALSAHIMTVYKDINYKFCHERRRSMAGARYNNGYDDREGHYVPIIGEEIASRYTVQEVLGKGSYGTVLRCCDERYQESVAVKVIRSGSYFREQGHLEAEIVAYLNKNPALENLVVQLRKAFIWHGHIVLVFELLSFNLFQLIRCTKHNGVSLDLTRKFAYQLLQVLLQLEKHDPPIIHCDLKPENVVLRDSSRSGIRVIDFGSSCYQQASNWELPPPLPDTYTAPAPGNRHACEGKTKSCHGRDDAEAPTDATEATGGPTTTAAPLSSTTADAPPPLAAAAGSDSYTFLPKYIQSRFYRSPEVILELGYTTAIDRWSLGCLLVELHTGVPLFPGRNEVDMIGLFTAVLGPIPAAMIAASPKRWCFYHVSNLDDFSRRNRLPSRPPESTEEEVDAPTTGSPTELNRALQDNLFRCGSAVAAPITFGTMDASLPGGGSISGDVRAPGRPGSSDSRLAHRALPGSSPPLPVIAVHVDPTSEDPTAGVTAHSSPSSGPEAVSVGGEPPSGVGSPNPHMTSADHHWWPSGSATTSQHVPQQPLPGGEATRTPMTVPSPVGDISHPSGNPHGPAASGRGAPHFVLSQHLDSQWCWPLEDIIGVHSGGPRGCRKGQSGHGAEAYITFLDFIRRLLVYDPRGRMGCEEALCHPFLGPLLEMEARAMNAQPHPNEPPGPHFERTEKTRA